MIFKWGAVTFIKKIYALFILNLGNYFVTAGEKD